MRSLRLADPKQPTEPAAKTYPKDLERRTP
jgi:hypothetical protein